MIITMKTKTDSLSSARLHPVKYQDRGLSLQLLVNQLLANSMPTAFHSKTLVINEISRAMELSKDRAGIAPVIRDLLSIIIINARNGQIHISADRFRDITTLYVQERNNNNGYALGYSVRTLEQEAAVHGANISITGEQQRIVTISISFPNNAEGMNWD
jgi:hypothetical protein